MTCDDHRPAYGPPVTLTAQEWAAMVTVRRDLDLQPGDTIRIGRCPTCGKLTIERTVPED